MGIICVACGSRTSLAEFEAVPRVAELLYYYFLAQAAREGRVFVNVPVRFPYGCGKVLFHGFPVYPAPVQRPDVNVEIVYIRALRQSFEEPHVKFAAHAAFGSGRNGMHGIYAAYEGGAAPDEVHESVLVRPFTAEAARLIRYLPGIYGLGVLETLYDEAKVVPIELFCLFVDREL